ncbi:MAG: hypothetical protein HWE07_12280 [Cytophagia bacterium]|nr:hypothetical protein [Cytophagia bacterium]
MLEKSLDLLYKNYNNQFKHDILIFHEGDFSPKDQEEVTKGRQEISFHQIKFEIPQFLNKAEIPEKWDGLFGIGHRHMIRFYAIQIFDILKEMGYNWFFRMDDDSFFHSKIEYDLFDYMAKNGFEYGYRVDVKEPERTSFGFSEMILAYLKAERIKPHTFLENFEASSRVNDEYFGFRGKLKRGIASLINHLSEKINHDLNNWPPPSEWNRWGYYNNFFITKIDFWLQSEVQSLIHHFDRTGGIYKYRWNDLIFQSAVVQTFLPGNKVHKFTDWTYEHATIRNGKLNWGGIYPGELDKNNPAIEEFINRYGKERVENSY